MKTIRKLFVCTIVLCIAFTACIGVGFAQAADETTKEVEIQTLRDAYSKTYQLPDGSYRFVGYASLFTIKTWMSTYISQGR